MALTQSEVTQALTPFEFAPGRKASWATLKSMLEDVDSALFFAKAFRLDAKKLSELLRGLFNSTVLQALSEGGHSTSLQDYIIDTVTPAEWQRVKHRFTEAPAQGEILPAVWDNIDLKVAQSIQEVADKLSRTLDALPSKEGKMLFKHLAQLNRQRPTIGRYAATIDHSPVPDTLVILDVSGSMTENTIRRIIEDVVAMSWKANATLAIVSNNTFVWEPGTYNVQDVLAKAEYGGTHYETLEHLFDGRSWGAVITIADYDSSMSAKRWVASSTGRIGKVLDLSLVNRPTFLAEVVGQLADEVEPLLIASGHYVLTN